MDCNNLLLIFSILVALVLCNAVPILEQEYKIEGFQKDGDLQTLVLRIQPKREDAILSANRQGRQADSEDENDGDDPPVPSTTPFIPAVIPALTKIFTGILTGNLNDIFHGSTSFAPQNVSYAIDTVYNSVVGIAAPISTQRTTPRPFVQPAEEATPPPPPPPKPAAPVAEKPPSPVVSSSSVVAPGQPLQGNTLVITTSSTKKPTSNEDDEDESDVFEGLGFRKLKGKDGVVAL